MKAKLPLIYTTYICITHNRLVLNAHTIPVRPTFYDAMIDMYLYFVTTLYALGYYVANYLVK